MKARPIILMGLSLAIILGLTACSPSQPTASRSSEDILTQKETPQDKISITVLVKNAYSINAFEEAVEVQFPNINLIQVGNYTSNMGIAEYERRLANDDLTDIVMTWPLDVGEQYWEDRLLDLSALPDTSQYNVSMLNNIARDGKLFYLPGPSQVRGILYNKTLFAENGWTVPKDFDEFVALCRTIEATGIRSLQLGLGNAEVLDTAFVGYSYGACFSTPADAQWIIDYNGGKGSFGDQFSPALDTFQVLIDAGILKKEDLGLFYQDREEMLFTRQCAMVEDSVLLARMGFDRNGCTDEFALMPFFTPGAENDWARLYPVCYIGLNKHLAEPENKEKYDAVLELISYISTPEGQEALMADTGAMYSGLSRMPPPEISEIEDLVGALTRGRFAIFPTLEKAQDALREGLAGMVRGDLMKEDVIKMVDAKNLEPSDVVPLPVLGTATEDFSIIETGNFVTDAMRSTAGTEIALFLDNGKDGRANGKGISGRLYAGEITATDIGCVMPDLKHGEAGVLQKITMSGADLLRALEHTMLVDNDKGGWFYYFSGLRMEYAPAAAPGSRIRKITDLEGKDIDPGRIYTVAIMDGNVSEDYIQSLESTNVKISDVIADAVQTSGTISPSGDGRFTVSAP